MHPASMRTAPPDAEEYAMLAAMAKEYRDAHIVELKQTSHYNPHLGVDALCFQRLTLQGGETVLAGALLTPCALWLVALPVAANADAPAALEPEELTLALPRGTYRLYRHAFGRRAWFQRRVLDDLSELGSLQEAARLAQQLMARLFADPAEDGGR